MRPNHTHVRSLGIQYLFQNPEQLIESNTENSWQGYLNNTSCPGTWANTIIVQAVANCFNLSIKSKFCSCYCCSTNKFDITHIDDTHYVSTVEKSTFSSEHQQNNMKCGETLVGNSLTDKNEKHRAYKSKYMKEYTKKRRADVEFRKREKKMPSKDTTILKR